MKYAFITNVEDGDPKDYLIDISLGENIYRIYGADGFKEAETLFVDLVEEGFEDFDFCGDFDEEVLKTYAQRSDKKLKMNYSKYSEEELEKIEQLESLKEYGIIIFDENVSSVVSRQIKNDAYSCNTYVRIVGNMEQAKAAAKELVGSDIDFIELCSWFDMDKTTDLIAAIEGEVPVGSCGI